MPSAARMRARSQQRSGGNGYHFAQAGFGREARRGNFCGPFISAYPILEIAEQNGVNVVFADFGPSSERVVGLCDFENTRIYVNIYDSADLQAFTMDHELGHWLLHRGIFHADPDFCFVLPGFSMSNQNDPLEKRANKFAACLLVPSRLLRPVKNGPVSTLASIFGVSRTMMEFGLKNVQSKWRTK